MNKRQGLLLGIIFFIIIFTSFSINTVQANGSSEFLFKDGDWYVNKVVNTSGSTFQIGDELKAVIIEKNSSFIGGAWGETVYVNVYNKSVGEDHFDFLIQEWIAMFNYTDPVLSPGGGYVFNIAGNPITIACKNLTAFNMSMVNIFNTFAFGLNNSIGETNNATHWNGHVNGSGLEDGRPKLYIQIEPIKHAINKTYSWSWNATSSKWDQGNSFGLFNTSWEIIAQSSTSELPIPNIILTFLIITIIIFYTAGLYIIVIKMNPFKNKIASKGRK